MAELYCYCPIEACQESMLSFIHEIFAKRELLRYTEKSFLFFLLVAPPLWNYVCGCDDRTIAAGECTIGIKNTFKNRPSSHQNQNKTCHFQVFKTKLSNFTWKSSNSNFRNRMIFGAGQGADLRPMLFILFTCSAFRYYIVNLDKTFSSILVHCAEQCTTMHTAFGSDPFSRLWRASYQWLACQILKHTAILLLLWNGMKAEKRHRKPILTFNSQRVPHLSQLFQREEESML